MAAHIFWDNMFFATHPIVGLIEQPTSIPSWRRLSNDASNQNQKNWRAMSDVTGLVLAVRSWGAARDAVVKVQQGEGGSADELVAAKSKRRESWYSMVKLMVRFVSVFSVIFNRDWRICPVFLHFNEK